MASYFVDGSKAIMRVFLLTILFGLTSLCVSAGTPESARLKEPVSVELGGRQVSLGGGTRVQVLNKTDVMAVISVQVNGDPVITQISLKELNFLTALPVGTASAHPTTKEPPSSSPKNGLSVSPPVLDSPSSSETPTSDVPDLADNKDDNESLPDFNTTLSPQDIELPPTRFTALNGYFYIVINGTAVPVVYSLPMEGEHLAPCASNLIFYGPYPTEKTDLKGNIVPALVTKLGCSVFSFSFQANPAELGHPETAYWSKESGWFKAVMDARQEIIKGFGLKKEKLLLLGYSGGGAMVLNLAGAFPDEVEAVVSQGANLAPKIEKSNTVKWLIINNRGETNAEVTLPFYRKLKQIGCTALYCETTPSRGREEYHAASQEAYDLMYAFLAGILDQRQRIEDGQTDVAALWPYASPCDPLQRYRVVRTQTLDAGSLDGKNFDLLPSAAFALDWSKVCPPIQTITCTDNSCRLHVNFPASAKPKGLVIYYDAPDYDAFPRQFEDICSLAEADFVVVSPMFRMPSEKFAHGASDWIVSQSKLQSLPIHLVGYGAPGSQFLSQMNDITELSFKSINLVSLTDFQMTPAVRDKIEALAKNCGLYSFFACRSSTSSNTFTDLVNTLLDSQSRERGCQAITVEDLGDDDKSNVCQEALSTIMQTLNDYDGPPIAASADLWVDGVTLPTSAVVNQEANIIVHVHDRGIYGKTSTLELKYLGTVLAKQDMSFNFDGDQKITLSYTPTVAGESLLDIVLVPLPEEASTDKNETTATLVVGKN